MTEQPMETRPVTGAGTPADGQALGSSASRQISWYETFAYATRIAVQHGVQLGHGGLPIAGTQQWCGLPDDDARKLLSLIMGGVREALINDTHQAAVQQAGTDVHGGGDWSWLAPTVQRRRQIDILRKAS